MMWTVVLLTLGALLTTTSAGVNRNKRQLEDSSVSDFAKRTWQGRHFTWLTDEQKSELDDIVGSIDSQDENAKIRIFLKKTREFYNNVDDERAVKATSELQAFCKSQMMTFFDPEEMRILKNLRDNGAPKDQLFAKFNELTAELADTDDRAQVRLYAAFCKLIFKLE